MTELDLRGKRVFLRADLNVPQDDAGNITDDTRIRASVPGIRAALAAGARLMVTSHLGRPKEGEFKPADTLAPVAKRLSELLGVPVPVKAAGSTRVTWRRLPASRSLENCRINRGEKKNDEALARKMAALCDVLRQRRFRHRAPRRSHDPRHRQIRAVACAGPLMAAEIERCRARSQSARPLVAIVAGSKVSTKLTILDSWRRKSIS